MLSRRELLRGAACLAAALGPAACARPGASEPGVLVNDVHTGLNPTRVHRVERPASLEALQSALRAARTEGRAVSVAGGRHAMGGQQFGRGTLLIDTRGLDRVLSFDRERGLVQVEAGIRWPALVEYLLREQVGTARSWGIVQKQTGADDLCLGGSLAANAHGRGLRLAPLAQDVEALTLVDGAGRHVACSRRENPELFALAIGGYGLFGVIISVTLRLAPRRKLERVVEVIDLEALSAAFERRLREGFLYGDCQYATDLESGELLTRGVLSCYRPVPADTPMPANLLRLEEDDWKELVRLAHVDRRRAFQLYARHYLATSGQIYWSDTHQLSTYLDGYHRELDAVLRAPAPGSEMIGELYVPRDALASFLAATRRDFLAERTEIVYGTIRLIERDETSFLPWAREPWACVIVNLHTPHTKSGLARSTRAFRRLIDRAIEHEGSYFLTYHRWATREQVRVCHPRFVAFLRAKRRFDPEERFQSEWYRHYREMFALEL